MQQTFWRSRLIAVFGALAVGALASPPAAAGLLACPASGSVFLDGFEPRPSVADLSQPGPFAITTRSGVSARASRCCVFHAKPVTRSTACRSPIPRYAGRGVGG